MDPRLVAALKDVDGRVISTLEAAAAVWERKCLEAFSRMGELRDVVKQGDDGQCKEGDWFRTPLRPPSRWPRFPSCRASEGRRNLAAPAHGSAGGAGHGSRRPEELPGRSNGPGP